MPEKKMVETDPGLWKDISGWLWAVLGIPLKMLWSKADNAASKTELKEAIKASEDASHEFRETLRSLFANAETDRSNAHRMHREMQDKMHSTHVELLNKIGSAK